MLLSSLRPTGKLRPEWEFGTELRALSLAAGLGPISGLSSMLVPSLSSSPPALNAGGCPPKALGQIPTELGLKVSGGRARMMPEWRGSSSVAEPGKAPGEYALQTRYHLRYVSPKGS